MIQELRGPWSALEDLGNALAKRAILQRSDQEEERKRAGDRVNQLMQLAQAGVLPEGALQAQSVQDLQQFGIAPSSVFAIDDQTKADRARKLENERRKTATDEKRTAAQIENDLAQAELYRAQAKPKAPEPAKIPSMNEIDGAADSIVRGVLSQKGAKMADAYTLGETNHILGRLESAQRKAVMDAARSRWLERRAADGNKGDTAQSRMDETVQRAIEYGRSQVGPQGSATDNQYRDAVVTAAWQIMNSDPRFKWVLDANKKSPTLSTDLFVAYHKTKTTADRSQDTTPAKALPEGGALAKALGGIGYKGAGAAPAATTPAPDAATPGPGHAKRKYGVTPSKP